MCRSVLQLTILGYILVPIFTYDLWWLVIGYSFVMTFVGGYEAVSRPAYTFKVRHSDSRKRTTRSLCVVWASYDGDR